MYTYIYTYICVNTEIPCLIRRNPPRVPTVLPTVGPVECCHVSGADTRTRGRRGRHPHCTALAAAEPIFFVGPPLCPYRITYRRACGNLVGIDVFCRRRGDRGQGRGRARAQHPHGTTLNLHPYGIATGLAAGNPVVT